MLSRKILVFLILCLSSIFGLSLDEIKSNLAKNTHPDTLEASMQITIAADSFSSSSKLHLYVKGKQKFWMETVLPNGKIQKMIRNGNLAMVTNPMTGQDQVIPVQDAGIQNPLDYSKTALDNGTLMDILQSNGKYLVKLKCDQNSDTDFETFIYDASLNQITGIEKKQKDGAQASTSIQYCTSCSPMVPKKIDVNTISQGHTIKTSIDFVYMKPLAHIAEEMFRIEPR